MKKLWILLVLVLVFVFGLIDCSNDVTSPSETTYQIKNGDISILDNLLTGYWDGSSFIERVEHGDIDPDGITPKIETTRSEIKIFFDIGSKLCLVTDDFFLTALQNNIFTILGTTHCNCD